VETSRIVARSCHIYDASPFFPRRPFFLCISENVATHFVGVSAADDIIASSIMKTRRKKFEAPIMAVGGIVVKAGRIPLVAVVQRRKDGGWVLPRGKQKRRESALAAARREVEKETGHNVVVREFLGTTSCESGHRPKIVHFWLMASVGPPRREQRDYNKEVKWLSLNAAIASLTEPLEQAFLARVREQARTRLRRDKLALDPGNFAERPRSTSEFETPSGRKTSTVRINFRPSTARREEKLVQAESQGRTLVEPSLVRRFLRHLKISRHVANQRTGW
jgi:8-oxo-dGTP diphosphatase